MQRNLGAFQGPRGRARIQIEYDRRRDIQFWLASEQDVLFDVREIREPHESRAIVAKNVIDVRSAFSPWNGERPDPVRRMPGGILFVEKLSGHAIGETFH